jgi:hypothetical protein
MTLYSCLAVLFDQSASATPGERCIVELTVALPRNTAHGLKTIRLTPLTESAPENSLAGGDYRDHAHDLSHHPVTKISPSPLHFGMLRSDKQHVAECV